MKGLTHDKIDALYPVLLSNAEYAPRPATLP